MNNLQKKVEEIANELAVMAGKLAVEKKTLGSPIVEEATKELTALFESECGEVIGNDGDEFEDSRNPDGTPYGHDEFVRHANELRAEQRKLMKERLR